jgi:Skp family chaperone for outer membrane proteins
MRSYRLGLVALVGAVMLLGAAPAQAVINVGVVDIVEVTAKYTRVDVANQDLQADLTDLQKRNEKEANNVAILMKARDYFKTGDPKWKAANEDYMKGVVAYQGWAAVERAKIEVKHRDVLLEIYGDIAAAVVQIASEKKCDIVFTKAFLAPPQIDVQQAQGLEDLKARILNQRVLYPPPAAMSDLTDGVIMALNSKYKPPVGYVPVTTPTAASTGTGTPK